jgi:hypothetical protein
MEPLRANSWTEAYFYLKVTACESCSQGPWELQDEQPGPDDPEERMLRARCLHCGARRQFLFRRRRPDRQARRLEGLDLEHLNPTDEPSRIIDLGQWLSLFYALVDSAAKDPDKQRTRRLTFQAAQCLDEALKFYGDHDLPPASAFFTDRSRQAYADHPEKFARERLRQMRSRLPDLGVMVRRLSTRTRRPGPAKWWQFWRK